MALVSAR